MRTLLLGVTLSLLAACGGGESGPEATPGPSPVPSTQAAASPSPPTPAAPGIVTLVAGGDVMPGRSIGEGIRQNGPAYPFQFLGDLLAGAGLAFLNLEGPLTDGGQPADKDFVFRGPPRAAQGIADAGVDVVSLANNHVFDYGAEGLADTIEALDAAGVRHAGAGPGLEAARSPAIIERDGLRIAFLAYVNTPADSGTGFDVAGTQATESSPGVAWLSTDVVAAGVAAAKAEADIVVVSMHTGYEYQEATSELQRAAARAAIDAGAALVLGHHPHVLQGIERYGSGLIAYSLGNFVFDFDYVDYSFPGLPSALSALLRVQLTKDGVAACEVLPVIVGEADGLPRPVSGTEAGPVLERLRRLSDGSCGLG